MVVRTCQDLAPKQYPVDEVLRLLPFALGLLGGYYMLMRILRAQMRSGWLATKIIVSDETCTIARGNEELISFRWKEVARISTMRRFVTLADGRRAYLQYAIQGVLNNCA